MLLSEFFNTRHPFHKDLFFSWLESTVVNLIMTEISSVFWRLVFEIHVQVFFNVFLFPPGCVTSTFRDFIFTELNSLYVSAMPVKVHTRTYAARHLTHQNNPLTQTHTEYAQTTRKL